MLSAPNMSGICLNLYVNAPRCRFHVLKRGRIFAARSRLHLFIGNATSLIDALASLGTLMMPFTSSQLAQGGANISSSAKNFFLVALERGN